MTALVVALVLTAGMVADATGGRLAGGDASRPFAAVSIDSRTLPAGALFVALPGGRFDGHTFVDDAITRGAAGALVSRMPVSTGDAAIILVKDTLAALQQLARDVRRRSHARVGLQQAAGQ